MNYPKDISYKDRLLKLDLLRLENRRDLKDLVLIFKAKAGHVDLGHHDFFPANGNTPSHVQCIQI